MSIDYKMNRLNKFAKRTVFILLFYIFDILNAYDFNGLFLYRKITSEPAKPNKHLCS